MSSQGKQVWIGIALLLAAWVANQWIENHTEAQIAQADAEAAQAILASIKAHGIECPQSVTVAERK